MTMLPAAAIGLWAGILAGWGRVGPGTGWLLVGAGMLAVLRLGRHLPRIPRARDPEVGARAGLSPRDRILAAAGFLPDGARSGGGWRPAAASGLAFLALGAGWSGLRIAPPQIGGLEGRTAAFTGTARSDHRPFTFGWGMEVVVERVDGRPTRLPVWMSGHGDPPVVAAGDIVAGSGSFRTVEPDEGFGGFLADRGTVAVVSVTELSRSGPPRSLPLRLANAVRGSLTRGALASLSPRRAGLLLGLVIGDTRRMHPETEEDFRATGLGHLVAVSGSNVVMVLVPVLAVVALLGAGIRGRVLAGVAAVGLFALVTRWEPSVLRAAVMATLGLLGVLAGRRRETTAVLAGAVVVLLILDPRLGRSLGFRLSVAATVGIVLLAPRIAQRLRWLPRPLALAVGATGGAQAAVTPLLLTTFGIVPGVTILANVLAAPMVGIAFLGGSLAAGVSLLWGPVGGALGSLASLPIGYLEWVADVSARLPVPSLVGLGWVGPVAVAVVLVLLVRRRSRLGSRVALVALLPAIVWGAAIRAGPPPFLEARFFDVGQGDAALVRTPEGGVVLIDAGPDEQEVATKLAALGVTRIDLAVATHPHADHVEGFPAVFARHPVGVLWEPGCPGDSPSYARLLAAAGYEGVPVARPRGGERYMIGGLTIRVLGPDACAVDSPNDDSIVLLLEAPQGSVLLPGDAEVPAQLDLLEDRDPVAATVLKVPHHGSVTSEPAFFEAVRARLAVVSVGENDYGHPAPETLEGLKALGARVVRTDRAGDVVLTFEGRRVSVSTATGRSRA